MPARVSNRRVVTTDIQGDDSYVIISRPTVNQIQELMSELPKGSAEDPEVLKANITLSKKLLAQHVMEWNWVDETGTPLPPPWGNEDIMGDLTDQEMKFLTELLTVNTADAKKKN